MPGSDSPARLYSYGSHRAGESTVGVWGDVDDYRDALTSQCRRLIVDWPVVAIPELSVCQACQPTLQTRTFRVNAPLTTIPGLATMMKSLP